MPTQDFSLADSVIPCVMDGSGGDGVKIPVAVDRLMALGIGEKHAKRLIRSALGRLELVTDEQFRLRVPHPDPMRNKNDGVA